MRRKEDQAEEWSSVYDQFKDKLAELGQYHEKLNVNSPELGSYIDATTAALGFANLLRDNKAFVEIPGTRILLKTLSNIIVDATKIEIEHETINPLYIKELFRHIEMAFELEMTLRQRDATEKVVEENVTVKRKAAGA